MASKETRLKTSFHAFHYVYNKDFTTWPFSTNSINIFSYINVTAGFQSVCLLSCNSYLQAKNRAIHYLYYIERYNDHTSK